MDRQRPKRTFNVYKYLKDVYFCKEKNLVESARDELSTDWKNGEGISYFITNSPAMQQQQQQTRNARALAFYSTLYVHRSKPL